MHDLLLVIHFIGLAMALGAGFSNLFLGTVASKLESAERANFISKTMILIRMGQTGLGLLILSGFGLMTPHWKVLGEMPLLITKLSLVGVLLITVSIISITLRKAKKEGNPALMMKVRPLGMLNLFLATAIVILAVLTFH